MLEEIFSPVERRILKSLGQKKMTIAQITEKVYEFTEAPFLPHIGVASAVRRINEKCEFHRLPWFLNSMGAGRQGKTVWRDKK